MQPLLLPPRRTGRADFPHPALPGTFAAGIRSEVDGRSSNRLKTKLVQQMIPAASRCGKQLVSSVEPTWFSGDLSCGRQLRCECLRQRCLGAPDAGNPHVRCDEGGGAAVAWHAVSEPTLRGNPHTLV